MATRLGEFIEEAQSKRTYRRYMEKRLRKHRLLGQGLSVCVFLSAAGYLGWCVANANWEHWFATTAFLLAEAVFLVLFLLWANVLWNKRFHRLTGPPLKRPDLTVDVYIPTCEEPLPVIEATIRGALALEHEKKTVYVLDDGWSDEVKALTESLGAKYIRRPDRAHRKAGNLNHAFQHTTGDLILALDADHVPRPDMIRRLIGYFTLDKVAFVQTEQHFDLPEGDPWGNSDRVFYKVMQPGKDYDNAAISCGNGAFYRRKALLSVGGFSTWNLVEDVHTSMRLHAAGWVSVYHRKAYTKGTAPRDIRTHVKQRWQWAVDSLRLFLWQNPFTVKGLTFRQKVQYFHFGFNYMAFGLFLPVFFILPVWSLMTHEFMMTKSAFEYLLVRAPYFFFYALSNRLTTNKEHKFKVFQAQAGLFACYFNAFFAALFSRNRIPRYTVTSKVVLRDGRGARLYACLPHILLCAASLFAVAYGAATIRDDFWFLAVNICWAFWTVASLSRFIVLALSPEWFSKLR